jgi:hypothetical protein
MRNNSFIWMLLAVSELLGAAALAQISETPATSRNRFSLNSRIGYNISATFSTSVSVPSVSNPGPPVGSGIDRTYDDGYVRVDASGNRDGLTWNWGYVSSSQTPGNDTLLMSGYASQSSAFTSHADGDPQLGLDLSYARVLGNHKGVQWGLEAALGWTGLTIDDNAGGAQPLVRTTDVYSLGGIIPPSPPYSGTFTGPGALIGDAPISRGTTTIPGGAAVTAERSLRANVYGFRLGPFLEVPICRWLAFTASGGLAVAGVYNDFDVRETVTVPGSTSFSFSGHDSHSEWLVGGYAEGRLTVPLTERVRLSFGVEYQNLGEFSQTFGGRRAEIDFGQSIFLKFGVGYSF